MRGDRWRARWDGDRHSRAAAVSKNGTGVGICWQLGDVGSVASQIQKPDSSSSSCLAKKGSLKNDKQYRACCTASPPPRGACERISISAEGQGDALLSRINSDISNQLGNSRALHSPTGRQKCEGTAINQREAGRTEIGPAPVIQDGQP